MQVAASPPKAICLVPGDAVAGDRFRLDQHPFSLTLGEPVQFPLWYSSIRLADQVGEIVDIDDQQMKPLPTIQTVLELKRSRKSDQVPVFIDAELTEIGTYNWHVLSKMASIVGNWTSMYAQPLRPIESPIKAKVSSLALSMNKLSKRPNRSSPLCSAKRQRWTPRISRNDFPKSWRCPRTLGHPACFALSGHRLLNTMSLEANHLRMNRDGSTCSAFAFDRAMASPPMIGESGYKLRRVQGKLRHRGASSTSEAVILWRRIAGGFTAGQQKALYQDLLPRLRSILANDSKSSLTVPTNEAIELLRLVGSLELLPAADKAWLAKSGSPP